VLGHRVSARRCAAAGFAAIAVCLGCLTAVSRPLHAAAQNTNPCGQLWTDASADASAGQPSSQADQLDIVSGNLSDNGSSLTTKLTIKNLSATVPTGATASEYYLVWAFNGTSYYTNVEVSATGTTTYNYGTYSATTGFSGVGTATGTFTAGANGVVAVTVPFSAVGKPTAGNAFAAAGIFGETDTLTGVPGAGGLVSTVDGGPGTGTDKGDVSKYDYVVGQSCAGGGGGGSTPTPSSSATPAGPAGELNIAVNGFTPPVEIGASKGLGEPSLAHDSGAGNNGVDRLFIAAPQSIGNVNSSGGSPLFSSTDGGAHWSAPVRSQFCTGTGGGDSDLAVDGGDNVYSTDLWLGNSCISVSQDHGATFAAGSPFGQELQPGDDRPWLAYSKSANEIFGVYDGVDALHVTNTAPLVSPAVGVQHITDNVVIPESAVSSSATPSSVRACVCPPGGLAVDNSSGPHAGRLYTAYSDQLGMAVSYADPTCAGGCIAPTGTWTQTVVPNTAPSGSAFDAEWNFAPVKVDSAGTVYVAWGQSSSYATDSGGATIAKGGVSIEYAYSTDGGATFSAPIVVSTTTKTNVFPTLDVVSAGVVDVAWYGAPGLTGDPNEPGNAANVAPVANPAWNIYYARVSSANTASPSFTPEVAIQSMHVGCIESGGFTGTGNTVCPDRSLLDFFTLVDDPGQPQVVYTEGDSTNGVNLFFTHLAAVAPPAVPEVPLVPILAVSGASAVAIATRFRRRRAARAGLA
jgi:hypothetical protein